MSVETLRIELLEGALAKAGLVDRAALEQVLETDYLIREDCYSELLTMLEIERWVQAWQARLGQGQSSTAGPGWRLSLRKAITRR
jgi:hypothetical protein